MSRPLLVVAAALVAALSLAGIGAADVQPNDPAWNDQWAQRKIGLPRAWESTTGDPSVVIALIDTGVNTMPDLEGALVPGWDFVENDAVSAGHLDARDAGRQRDRRPRQQRHRHGRATAGAAGSCRSA